VVVNIFPASTTVGLNHFAEGNQIQTYDLVRKPHKKFYQQSIDTFCFIALASLLYKILQVLLKDTVYRKESFPRKESDTKLLQQWFSTFFMQRHILQIILISRHPSKNFQSGTWNACVFAQ